MKFRWETELKETEIGEIPRDWEVKKLGELIEEALIGSTPLKRVSRFWISGNVPWLTSKEIEYGQINFIEDTQEKVNKIALDETNLKLIPPNSLIISFTASVGKVAINKVPITTNQQFISFVLNNTSNVLFYGYYFLIAKDILESFSGATPFSFITKENALNIPVPYTPLPEQSRIAQVLSYFDDLIENKKKQNEILEKTAITIFKSWFIDFEPFKDQEFVYNEELGKEIPKGWEVKRLGEVVELIKGVSYNTPDISSNSEGQVFITLNNFLRGGGFKSEYSYYIGTRAKENHIVKNGDLIIAITDMTSLAQVVGAPAIVILPYGYEKGVISLDCAKIKLNNDYSKFYIYLYLKYTQEENSTFAGGVNVLHLKLNLFKANKFILIPPPSILQHFHSLVEPLFQKIILNQKQIMTLKKVRDTLLPLLVFGKLRVEEV